MLRRLFLRIGHVIGAHFGQLCTYEEWSNRPDKTDIRIWCAKCGHKDPLTEEDIRLGKVWER